MATNTATHFADLLAAARRRWEVERARPVSCTDAARAHAHVVDAHARLARLLARGKSEECRLLALTPSALLAEALRIRL